MPQQHKHRDGPAIIAAWGIDHEGKMSLVWVVGTLKGSRFTNVVTGRTVTLTDTSKVIVFTSVKDAANHARLALENLMGTKWTK